MREWLMPDSRRNSGIVAVMMSMSVAVSILTHWDGRGFFLSRSACLYCQIRDLAARLPRSYDWRSIRVRQRASALAKACIF